MKTSLRQLGRLPKPPDPHEAVSVAMLRAVWPQHLPPLAPRLFTYWRDTLLPLKPLNLLRALAAHRWGPLGDALGRQAGFSPDRLASNGAKSPGTNPLRSPAP